MAQRNKVDEHTGRDQSNTGFSLLMKFVNNRKISAGQQLNKT